MATTPQHTQHTQHHNGSSQQHRNGAQAWRNAAASQPAEQQTTPERSYERETQSPTHDALSAIYNRGYRE